MGAEGSLVVGTGPERGTIYRLLSPQIVIGRGSDCDIVLSYDQKCSRRHAMVVFTGAQFEVRDISDRNKLFVEGVETKQAVLREGSVFQLGNTQFTFRERPPLPTLAPSGQNLPRPNKPKNRPALTAPKLNPVRIVIIGIVILFMVLMFTQTAKNKKEVAIRTDEQIEADIAAANALQDAAKKERPGGAAQKSEDQEFSVDQAQASYIRGFRDYRKGQYGRAVEAFQACLTIYPQHVLCNRYLRLAQRKYNELIQYEMVLGRRYRDQEQYSACEASFHNVMSMLQDTNNATFKEAQANFQACHAFVEERY
jgi:pSer/pThr/pTyr-binding forkhead associated (FHA) protein